MSRLSFLGLAPLRLAALGFLLAWMPARAIARALALKLFAAPWTPWRRRDGEAAFDVVCLSHVAWSHIWQRNHHTMTRLARSRRVVYLQVISTSHVHVFARELPRSFGHYRSRHPDVVVRQALLLPGESRSAAVRRFNDWAVGVEIRWQAWRLGMRQAPALWFYHPAAVGALDYVDPAAVVYDIQDEYSAFRHAARGIAERERRLLDASDVVLAGTHELYVKKTESFRGQAYFYPCAVEFDRFSAAAPGSEPRPPEPPELAGLPRPRLLYMGLIDARIDPELVGALAAADPRWQVVMIGPVEEGAFPSASLAARHPNLRFTGQVPYARLPEFLAHADVYLMPWRLSELTLHINPTKTLEYLAAGRPVVSVRLPDLEAFFGATTTLVDPGDAAAFVEAVRGALDGRFAPAVAAGVEQARSLSWDAVVAEMADHVAMAAERRAASR